ncbi:MAG: hypothetical protein COU22_02115 [Candidatus Komeilibacteria bacterium CG10_big_fil_rev_8_21_14_0_10_41_13]|uniref:Magnesium transporter CorA n=1 Tax=Candidatus Komeilibacteria bacterium CG10_big_fil_rev_8_21_14_0_10_41_13 TaxID=1974476 RepID=A0A2M6WCE9_9BACT|nr:MAG: hypothetical protein COU22_02115 [Candidatus Komeilibacteria bacterium CG10_big_fil_rev_8_21_14_0_10_41_13]
MAKAKNIKEIKNLNLTWLHLNNNSKQEIAYLRNNFKFHPLDLEDCLSPAQRPKVDEYDDYLFLILTFPYYNHEAKEVLSSEVDFFIGDSYLVTVSDGNLQPLNNFFEQCQHNDLFRHRYLSHDPIFLLAEILNKIQLSLYPMLDHIRFDIGEVQKVIFTGYERKMVKEILMIKQNIINFRITTEAHKTILRKLLDKNNKFFIANSSLTYLNNNVEQAKDLWDNLESLRENIEALHQTNESLISFRLNDIMKVLTMISLILLPINLIASIFGMNTPIMPFVNHPQGFWIILGLMGLLMISFFFFFKKKKWM